MSHPGPASRLLQAALVSTALLASCSHAPSPSEVAAKPADPPPALATEEESNPEATEVIAPSIPAAPAEPFQAVDASPPTLAESPTPELAPTSEPSLPEKPVAPAETKPTKSPAKSAPEVDLLRQLPTAIELPPPPEASATPQPFLIGPLALPPDAFCVVHLLGGGQAVRGRKQFTCEEDGETSPARAWRIDLAGVGAAASNVVAIARVEARENKLFFIWLPAAADDQAVAALTNCVLRLTVGSSKKLVNFRKPILVPAVAIGFERSAGQWEIPNPPRAENIKVELRLAGGRQLRYRFVGSSTLAASNDETWLQFGLARNGQGAMLKLETSHNRFLKVSSIPHFQLATQPKPVPLSPEGMRKAEADLKKSLALLEKQLQAFPASAPAPKGKGPPVSPAAQAKASLTKQMQQVRQAQDQLKEVQALGPTLEDARLHVRVFYATDDATVELLQTQGAVPTRKR